MLQIQKFKFSILITILCWIIGFFLVFDSNLLFVMNEKPLIQPELTKPFITYFHDFINILCNNLTVALIISMGGYFSFGIISIFGSLHNGFILAIYVNSFLNKYSIAFLYKVMLHAPTEFLALFYFGTVGVYGIENFKKVIKKQDFDYFDSLPPIKSIIIPLILLFISAMIESDLIFLLIKNT